MLRESIPWEVCEFPVTNKTDKLSNFERRCGNRIKYIYTLYVPELLPFSYLWLSHLFQFLLIALGIENCFECTFHYINIAVSNQNLIACIIWKLWKNFESVLKVWISLMVKPINLKWNFFFLLQITVTIFWLNNTVVIINVIPFSTAKCQFRVKACEISSNKSWKYYLLFLLRLWCKTANSESIC